MGKNEPESPWKLHVVPREHLLMIQDFLGLLSEDDF